MKKLYFIFIALAFFGLTALVSCGGTKKPAEEPTEEVEIVEEEVVEEAVDTVVKEVE